MVKISCVWLASLISLYTLVGPADARPAPRPVLKIDPKPVTETDAQKLERYRGVTKAPVVRLDSNAPERLVSPRRRETADQQKRRLVAANAKTKPIATITVPLTITGPHIARVDGVDNGRYEPGGQYVVRGRGFGARAGSVFLKDNGLGRSIPLKILHWSDERLYVELPAGLSGIPDVPKVTLVVGPVSGGALENRSNGFYAARQDHKLTVLPGTSLAVVRGRAVDSGASASNGHTVRRYAAQGANDSCFQPGTDRIDTTRLGLKPGFWVESFDVWFPKLENYVDTSVGEVRYTGFGRYDKRWDGDHILIDWGVQRRRTAPWTVVPGASQCEALYRITLNVTGPRGLPMR